MECDVGRDDGAGIGPARLADGSGDTMFSIFALSFHYTCEFCYAFHIRVICLLLRALDSIIALRWVPSARLVGACIQAFHVFSTQFEVVDVCIFFDPCWSDRLGQRNETLQPVLVSHISLYAGKMHY